MACEVSYGVPVAGPETRDRRRINVNAGTGGSFNTAQRYGSCRHTAISASVET